MQLAQHPFFSQVAPPQLDALIAAAQVTGYEPGAIIFEEGADSDALLLLLEGEVGFSKHLPNGTYRTISTAREGGFFGEVGLFTGQPRALRAEARGPATLASIPRDALVQFIKGTPGPIDHILQSIINHLHATTRHYITDVLRQEKMAMVGNMVNTIIHDFKNPFCLISLGAQLIRVAHRDEKTLKLCKNIEDQVQRMVAMAEELGEFSRGSYNLKLAPVNIPLLMDKFRELYLLYFQSPKVTIYINVADITIEAEEAKLIRVFQNLVGNAVEHLEGLDRKGEIFITATLDPGGKHMLLTLADNGNGIPTQIRTNFFEPFVTHGKAKGTGLGTAIVKSIVEAHGGTITFETETGQGTTFNIRFPLKFTPVVRAA